MTTMWMVRGDGGRLYDDFRDLGIVGIGWSAMANQVKEGMSRDQLAALYRECYPGAKKGRVVSGASQVWRFVNEVILDTADIVLSCIGIHAAHFPTNKTAYRGQNGWFSLR